MKIKWIGTSGGRRPRYLANARHGKSEEAEVAICGRTDGDVVSKQASAVVGRCE